MESKLYAIFNAHALISENKKGPRESGRIWSRLEEIMFRTADKCLKILMGEDVSTQIGKEGNNGVSLSRNPASFNESI